jgi:hypothetical protein
VCAVFDSGDGSSRRPDAELEENLLEAGEPDFGELQSSCFPVTGLCPGVFPCRGPGSRLNN